MIYMDNAATTALSDQVLQAMLPWFQNNACNPSASYRSAREARRALEKARKQCASLIHAEPDEIIFTSGGTESDNQALRTVCEATGKKHIVTTSIEHPAVLRTSEYLERRGIRVTYLPVDENGLVHPDAVREAITEDTAIVSVMAANNEVGTIQPVSEIGAICKETGVLFHTDAVQAYGHIPIDVKAMGIDLLSASAHKLHGPKGVGLLYIRKGIGLQPLIYGGGQENGMRSGTLNVPGIVGFGAAAEHAGADLEENIFRMRTMRDLLIHRIINENPGARLNGHPDKRLPGNAHVSFPGVNSADLVTLLDTAGICAAAGSACSTHSGKPSHVLTAMGLDPEVLHGSLRLTLSEQTTEEEINKTADALKRILTGMNELS